MSEEAQALFLNAIPLLALTLVSGAAAVVVARASRGRGARDGAGRTETGTLGGVAVAAAILGAAVLVRREPLVGNAWLGLGAVLAALVPAGVALRRRPQEVPEPAPAEPRGSEPERDRAVFAAALVRATDVDAAARLLVGEAVDLLGVEFGSLTLVDGSFGRGLYALHSGEEAAWWRELEFDLKQPSAISSVAFEGAPFAVYDVASSPAVNQEIAQSVGAKSGLWHPVVAEGRVVAVLALVTTETRRTFSADDVALVQELAADAAVTLDRLDTRPALARQLSETSLRLRSERDLEAAVAVAAEGGAAALGVPRCVVQLAPGGIAGAVESDWRAPGLAPLDEDAARAVAEAVAREGGVVAEVPSAGGGGTPAGGLAAAGTRALLAAPIVAADEAIGVISFHAAEARRWTEGERAAAETLARELGAAVAHARQLRAERSRLEYQAALLAGARALTSDLELDEVLPGLVRQLVVAVGADAGDVWIFDDETALLRCRAVHGLPEGELGRAVEPSGVFAEAIGGGEPVLRQGLGESDQPVPGAAYAAFGELVAAPVAGERRVRGVVAVRAKESGRLRADVSELVDGFAGLATLALRNAEALEERARQARVQRGFYRVAAVLGEPLSRAETYAAVAQAAADALGGSAAAVLVASGTEFELVAAQDLPEPLERCLEEGVSRTGPLLTAAAEGARIVASADVSVDDRFDEVWRRAAQEAGYRGLLAVPLERPREGGGLVLVFFRGARRFSDDDLELAEHLARVAVGALERSGLYEEERAARSLAQQLARTGSLLATELDPAAVLEEVVRQAPRLVGVDACVIRELEDDELVVSEVEGRPEDAALIGSRSPGTGWLSGDVVQSRAPLALADAAADERLLAVDPLLGLGYRAYLGVPLNGPEDSLHGVLAVYSRTPRTWRNEEIEALLALAANAAAALSNADLYQRVADEKERSSAILANIADGIVALDREGHAVLWNRAAEEITGVPAAEAVGHTPAQVLGRDLAAAGDTAAGNRLVSIVRGSDEVWLSLTEAIMRDPLGAVAGRIYAFRDISADRFVEQMKSDFVSTVSQELRRPLTSIYGFAETLLRRDVLFGEEERRTFLGYIASESERLTTIVDALLNVARLDSGELQVNLAPVDVGAVASEVVAGVEALDLDGHRFVVDLPDEPLAADADPDKLRQVLSNLLDNAVKFSPAGGTVTVSARRRAETVQVSVADEGIGIPQAEHRRIFRKFYRGDAGSGRGGGGGGTGLGLFIAEGLVTAMGGRIWVTSAERQGAKFTFELRAAPTRVPGAVNESAAGRV